MLVVYLCVCVSFCESVCLCEPKCVSISKWAQLFFPLTVHGDSQVALVVKNLPDKAGDVNRLGFNPWVRKSLGGGNGNPLQYSHLENPMGRGAWRATICADTESQTRLSTIITPIGTVIIFMLNV